MKHIAWVLTAIFAALQLLDIWTTNRFLACGGYEVNPLINKAIEIIGEMPALIAIKAFGIFAVVAANFYYGETYYFLVILAALNIFYGWVGWNNWKICKLDNL